MSAPILQVRDLTTRIHVGNSMYKVVDNVSFDLYPGKTLALVGESGSGKSMTALSILRILPTPPALPSEGEVLYKGQNLLTLSDRDMRKLRGARISMIFQDPSTALNPVYTVADQLGEVAELHLGLDPEQAWARSVAALKEVGIPAAEQRMYDYPFQLSGGMRQRVMIAMALMCEPDILIADEPTTALDVTIQAQVLELIKELQRKRNMAVLLITHDMGVVAEMADDVMIMYASQAIERGSVEQIFDHMAHPYTQGLFQSRPSYKHAKGKLTTIKGSVPSIRNIPKGCPFHPRCPHVMDICKEGAVPNFVLAQDPLHDVRCWLYKPQ